jgi:hypothetical protein
MNPNEFHERLTHLMPKLDVVLAAGGDFSNLPTYSGRFHGNSYCTPEFLLRKIKPLMEVGPEGDPQWPRADSPAAIINLREVDVAFTDPAKYVMRPRLAFVVDIRNMGKFVLYITQYHGEYSLTGWSYLSKAGGDYTYFYLGLPDEKSQSEGQVEFLSDVADYIYNRVEHTIDLLAADVEIKQVGLNCTNAKGLYNFASNDGWSLLPWISNNQYTIARPEDYRIESKLGWDQHGPFDMFGMEVSVAGEPTPRIYTVVILNRSQVVECYGCAKGQPKNVLLAGEQMVPFWDALQSLVDDAQRQLRTSL